MTVLLLLACAQSPVIGMGILATVTCEGECTGVSNAVTPCRCSAPIFELDNGLVRVERSQLTDDAAVVLSLNYDGDLRFCGTDRVIGDEPDDLFSVTDHLPLYTVDSAGTLTPAADSPIVNEAGDELEFEYAADGATWHETHTVTFRQALDVEPYDELIGCCGYTGTNAAASSLIAALALVLHRRGAGSPVLPGSDGRELWARHPSFPQLGPKPSPLPAAPPRSTLAFRCCRTA